jgi:3-phosphoshikimate 1-carboxyvinyltransferase
LNATPDALPIMAAAAAAIPGETHLVNAPQARIKETDRIACMTCELRKMGADITELQDGMIIRGGKLHGAVVDGHADHRIVMALAIAALTADGESLICGSEAAAVTYPDFVRDFQLAGAKFQEEE